ncbi:MAG TPA: 4a-hydroxytetrahydrobiopterin dehydratase [Candidatus Paceibacterota bacterium]|nr:4a-hydroxytetrahydrobiopterin dehydratase [Candidatus Paceibacterota bacterium]
MAEDLSKKHCIPCEGGTLPIPPASVANYLERVPGWSSPDNLKIVKEFEFKDFKEAMGFVNKLALIAEAEGHHPDIYIFYNKVRLELSTHAIGGLSENDFILAARANTEA